MSQVLAEALTRLVDDGGSVPASAFTTAQRRALDELARKTGVLRVTAAGRGSVYQVVNAAMLAAHLKTLRPRHADDVDSVLPKRAANIARTRSSKSAAHGHAWHYLLVKAISGGVTWEVQQEGSVQLLDLSAATNIAGAGVLAIEENDTWRSEQPLWLVENQALFDRLDWMPLDAVGTIAYYAGQLPVSLLSWIAARQRTSEVILFPDYDGVGLFNYARLREASAGPCSFWLMPDWRERLSTFGSQDIWQNTQGDFQTALSRLEVMGMDDELAELCRALSRKGMGLEQESVWLSVSND